MHTCIEKNRFEVLIAVLELYSNTDATVVSLVHVGVRGCLEVFAGGVGEGTGEFQERRVSKGVSTSLDTGHRTPLG